MEGALQSPLGPSGLEIAWAAGLFDGEGTVLIGRHGPEGRRRYNAELKVDILHKATVERLKRTLGGAVESYTRQGRSGTVWRWRITGQAVKAVIAAILPHSTTKAAELTVLSDFLAIKAAGAYTLADRAACQAAKERLEALRCSTKRAASSSRP